MNLARFQSLGADDAVRISNAPIHLAPTVVRRTPADLLWENHKRRPLRCDDGPVRNNLAAAQAAAAARSIQPSGISG